ncbi:MAG: phenylacetate--CoA ligase family protein, partial [Gammaproteobacteria bacterium]
MKFRIRDYFFPDKILNYRRLMREAPGWSVEHLAEWSKSRRMAIVKHAYENVPYYRRVLDGHRIRPEQVDRPEVWARIPTLDKLTLKQNTGDLIAGGAPPKTSAWARTSGSTGLNLSFLLDSNVNAAAFALFWRCWESGGYWRIGQRQAAIKGVLTKKGGYYEQAWKYSPILRTLRLSPVQINAQSARRYRDVIARYRPRFIRTFPASLYLLCRLLREQGLELHIPMVVTGAEVLYDFQRKEFETTLGARVYNHYTHWERAASILECEAGNLHCQEDYGNHEILDHEGRPVPPGVVGEITATGLHNLTMPLIRYRTGDTAAWSLKGCSCGQSFPIVERIEGRLSDGIYNAEGLLVSGDAVRSVITPFLNDTNILYSQVIQADRRALEVRIVKGPGYRDPEDTEVI